MPATYASDHPRHRRSRMKVRQQLRYIVANWNRPDRRPVWQIAALIPLWLISLPARWFVSKMDRL